MSFAGSIQMIFFPMLTCTIGFQGGPNKMAAANFPWLQFPSNRSSIQSLFLETSGYILSPHREPPDFFFFHFVVFLVIIIGVRGCFAVLVVIRGFKNMI